MFLDLLDPDPEHPVILSKYFIPLRTAKRYIQPNLFS